MSVYARRIISIRMEDTYLSFNLWKDAKLVDFLDSESDFRSQLSDDGRGIGDALVVVVEQAVERANELELDPETVTNLKKDIAWAKSHNQEFIQYYCY